MVSTSSPANGLSTMATGEGLVLGNAMLPYFWTGQRGSLLKEFRRLKFHKLSGCPAGGYADCDHKAQRVSNGVQRSLKSQELSSGRRKGFVRTTGEGTRLRENKRFQS